MASGCGPGMPGPYGAAMGKWDIIIGLRRRINVVGVEFSGVFLLVICDIDIFKQVNDLHGHTVGDLILRKVARLLTTTFRSIDYVCRIGGDEFAVIMVNVGRELSHTVSDKIELINDALSNPTDGLPAVSLSVGVAFTDRENPGESIFKDADQALYRVKQNGKHDCGFY